MNFLEVKMKKIILLLLVISAVTFTAPANKSRNQSLNTTVQNSKKGETAQEAWERVKPEIKMRLDKISKDLIAGNYKASFDEMPEKFLAYLAKKASVSTNELKNATIKKMNQMTSNMKIIENTYNFENVKVGKTETGRNYVIIPTKVTILYDGQKISGEGKTMVFEDGNKWYIINYEKEYMIFLKDVYPDLAKIK